MASSDKTQKLQGLDMDNAKPNLKRLLVLEDELDIHKLLKRLFARFDYNGDFCTTGEECIAKYEAAISEGNSYDLVILDLKLPQGLNGNETLKKLREINPEVKAVASSGYFDAPIMQNHTAYGFIEILPKPYTINELLTVLKKCLQN